MFVRGLLVACAALLVSVSVEAQTFVQFKLSPETQPFFPSATTVTITADSNFTVGGAVCSALNQFGPKESIVSVVDNGSGGSNTFALMESDSSTTVMHGDLYCAAVERVANAITFTVASSSTNQVALFLAEFTGTHAVDPFGGSSSGNATGGTSHSTGTVTVQAPASVIWGYTYGHTGTYTIDATFTLNAGGDATKFVSGQKSVTADTAMVNTSAIGEATVSLAVEMLPAVPPSRVRCVPLVSPTCDV